MPETQNGFENVLNSITQNETTKMYDDLAAQMNEVRAMGIPTEYREAPAPSATESPRFSKIEGFLKDRGLFEKFQQENPEADLAYVMERVVDSNVAAMERNPGLFRRSIASSLEDFDNLPDIVQEVLGVDTLPEEFVTTYDDTFTLLQRSTNLELTKGQLGSDAEFIVESDVVSDIRYHGENDIAASEINPRQLIFLAEACGRMAESLDQALLTHESTGNKLSAAKLKEALDIASAMELKSRSYRQIANDSIAYRIKHSAADAERAISKQEASERKYTNIESQQEAILFGNSANVSVRKRLHENEDLLTRRLEIPQDEAEEVQLSPEVYMGAAREVREIMLSKIETHELELRNADSEVKLTELSEEYLDKQLNQMLVHHPKYREWARGGKEQSLDEFLARISTYNSMGTEQKIRLLMQDIPGHSEIATLHGILSEPFDEAEYQAQVDKVNASGLSDNEKEIQIANIYYDPRQGKVLSDEQADSMSANLLAGAFLRNMGTFNQTFSEYSQGADTYRDVAVIEQIKNLAVAKKMPQGLGSSIEDNARVLVLELEELVGGYEAVDFSKNPPEPIPFLDKTENLDNIVILGAENASIIEPNRTSFEGPNTHTEGFDAKAIPEDLLHPKTTTGKFVTAYRVPLGAMQMPRLDAKLVSEPLFVGDAQSNGSISKFVESPPLAEMFFAPAINKLENESILVER